MYIVSVHKHTPIHTHIHAWYVNRIQPRGQFNAAMDWKLSSAPLSGRVRSGEKNGVSGSESPIVNPMEEGKDDRSDGRRRVSCMRVWKIERERNVMHNGTSYILCIEYNMKTRSQPIVFDERRQKRFDRNQKTHPDVSGNSDSVSCPRLHPCMYLYIYVCVKIYIHTHIHVIYFFSFNDQSFHRFARIFYGAYIV